MNNEALDSETQKGVWAIEEMQKRAETFESVKKDISKISELSPHDWLKLILYINKNNESLKTKLAKTLFLLWARSKENINSICWQPSHYGPYNAGEFDNCLKQLKDEVDIKPSYKDKLIYITKLKNANNAKELYEALPENIKQILQDLVKEVSQKSTSEIEEYVHTVYPQYNKL